MIKEFVKAWDANKANLQEYFETHEMREYSEYKDLVRALFEIVINPYIKKRYGYTYDIDCIEELDHGDYQGTKIFWLHVDRYQPCAKDYVSTHNDYGSCSGCDTLMGIQCYCDGLPTEVQVSEHMTLCLHLLQRCVKPFDLEL